MLVLIAGFEPFGDFPINSSQECVQALQQDRQLSKWLSFETCILPVERKHSFELLASYLKNKSFTHIFLMGMASHSIRISVEKVAINWSHYSIPDNAQQQPIDERIEPEAPDAYFSNMSVLSLANLQPTHIPLQLSLSAGSYVCNDLYFRTLHWVTVHHYPAKVVFLHLPMLISAQFPDNTSGPTFSKEEIYEDVVQIISRGVME